jgi:ribosomal protein S18 acetylase RimI-like enzyme
VARLRCDLLYTVAGSGVSNGMIAGLAELVVPGDGRGDGWHYGTGVLSEYRGHGLGRSMKAEAIRQAVEYHPDLDGLLTG